MYYHNLEQESLVWPHQLNLIANILFLKNYHIVNIDDLIHYLIAAMQDYNEALLCKTLGALHS